MATGMAVIWMACRIYNDVEKGKRGGRNEGSPLINVIKAKVRELAVCSKNIEARLDLEGSSLDLGGFLWVISVGPSKTLVERPARKVEVLSYILYQIHKMKGPDELWLYSQIALSPSSLPENVQYISARPMARGSGPQWKETRSYLFKVTNRTYLNLATGGAIATIMRSIDSDTRN